MTEKPLRASGEEWSRSDQSGLLKTENVLGAYFSIFPWPALSQEAVGFDLGYVSAYWAKLVAPRGGELHRPQNEVVDTTRVIRGLSIQPNQGVTFDGEGASSNRGLIVSECAS